MFAFYYLAIFAVACILLWVVIPSAFNELRKALPENGDKDIPVVIGAVAALVIIGVLTPVMGLKYINGIPLAIMGGYLEDKLMLFIVGAVIICIIDIALAIKKFFGAIKPAEGEAVTIRNRVASIFVILFCMTTCLIIYILLACASGALTESGVGLWQALILVKLYSCILMNGFAK